MDTKLRLVLSTTILFLSFYGSAQTTHWKRDVASSHAVSGALRRMDIRQADSYSLAPEFFGQLRQIPRSGKKSPEVIYFPNAEGKMEAFSVRETPVFAPALAARYPEIRSYSGNSLDHPGKRIRFSMSHQGLQAMTAGAGKSTFIQKMPGGGGTYLLYQRDLPSQSELDFICMTQSQLAKSASASPKRLVDDQVLRQYRIAISTTGEYTQYHGGTKADALAAINATLSRVNEIYETDLGITLQLISETEALIFTDPATDPYGNNLNSEVQNTLTSTLGEAAYDLGHLFQRGSDSGNAGFIGSVCKDNQKGSAFSSAHAPEGDVFDLDFVAHEIGHQFGANHTWSFESESTGVQAEPASGSTIMGYAGIVDGENVQPNGDDYFHYYSILQISNYVQGSSCAEVIPITNNPPVVADVGDYVIPRGTAFVLTGEASDPDAGDILSYAWEQVDDGVVTTATFGPGNATGANFRSFRPDPSPSRYFPKLEEVVNGNLTQTNPQLNSAWETVSNIGRDLNFALTVRDNASGGGQVASDLVYVQVVNNAGPFLVTSQADGEIYEAGSLQTVTWSVAGTQLNPVAEQEVDIFLSVDGGQTFPISLVEATANDGTEEVLIPGISTTDARIMVRAHNNIFFAVNTAGFSITESDVVLQFPQLKYRVCQPDPLQIPFSYETFGGFSEEVTFSATGFPGALGVSFTPPTAVSATDPVLLDISGTDQIPAGIYEFTVTATSASQSKQLNLQLEVLDGSFAPPVLTSPADQATEVSINTLLQWNESPSYDSYILEIATDPAFSEILETASVVVNAYKPELLQPSTTYYWRVKPVNQCGEGNFTDPFVFDTVVVNCQERVAVGGSVPISSVGTPVVTKTVNFLDHLAVSEVRVGLDLDHTFLGDLIITLISPSGTEVVLIANSCGGASNLEAVFDDNAPPFVCGNNPAINGTVRPVGSLASFQGESAFGKWTLRISDTALDDGGALNAFRLEICAEGEFRPDADTDGVFDDGDDLCPNTPPGTEVNPDGCPVYRFDPNNFTVAITSESCISSNNGAISVSATQIMDYSIRVSGPGISGEDSFTSTYRLDGLTSGTYNLCIGGTDEDKTYEEYCFELQVGQPEPLGVALEVTPDGGQAVLTLSGAERYTVALNGQTRTVPQNSITLELKAGLNTLKIYTSLACQGTYEEELYYHPPPVWFPNPVQGELTIATGIPEGTLRARIYNGSGRMLGESRHLVNAGEIRLSFEGMPPGLYVVQLQREEYDKSFKVIKE